MESSLYRYVVRHSLRQQVLLVALAFSSFPFLYLFYELPKQIVNGAIAAEADGFPKALFGLELERLGYLALLCGGFLALVLINQAFKYAINVYKGLTSERMLRRLRYELYSRLLRFPLPAFRKVSAGEIIPMITSEVEPLGGFAAEAFALPVFQGGTLLVVLAFLFVQNPVMAAAAVALYPLQILVIPSLQRRINQLAKERVASVRKLAERVGESVDGIAEIRSHGASARERVRFAERLHSIFEIRYAIYFRKFLIKFINNFAQHLGPFFFYAIGGYLVIAAKLDLGTLIAALAAHKDLAAPWRELLAFYQQKEDARIKYLQVTAQFSPAGLLPAAGLAAPGPEEEALARSGSLKGDIALVNVSVADDFGRPLIEEASLRIAGGERVALLGDGASRADELALVLAGLVVPTKGRVTVAGRTLSDLPETVLGSRIAYVGADARIFSGTLGENLFFGLAHRWPEEARGDAPDIARRRREAARCGNAFAPPGGDWTDYEAAGARTPEDLPAAGFAALRAVGMERDVYRFGLAQAIDPARHPDLAEAALAMRTTLRERLKDPQIAPLVENFDSNRYALNASLAENLFFGLPADPSLGFAALAEHDYVQHILKETGLADRLLDIGHIVAANMIELFTGLPKDHPFFEQFSFIDSAALPDYEALLARVPRHGAAHASPADRALLLALPLRLVAARHRFGVIDENLQRRVVLARRLFASGLPADIAGRFVFLEEGSYIAPASLADNMLFGKIAHGVPEAASRIQTLIEETVEAAGLRERIAAQGLDWQVGVGGGRLGAAERQKLALARAILKRPDLLVLGDAINALDPAEAKDVAERILDLTKMRGSTLVWRLSERALAQSFDRAVLLRHGRVAPESAASPDAAGEVSAAASRKAAP